MQTKEEYFQHFEELVKGNKIVLFIKGTYDRPACGFSAHTVEIVDSYGQAFHTENVLGDQYKKEYLKEFSNWPTMPQLYVNGELIGGADIVAEMHKNNELKAIING